MSLFIILKILETLRKSEKEVRLFIDEHKEISRLNVSGVDNLSVTWNILKR